MKLIDVKLCGTSIAVFGFLGLNGDDVHYGLTNHCLEDHDDVMDVFSALPTTKRCDERLGEKKDLTNGSDDIGEKAEGKERVQDAGGNANDNEFVASTGNCTDTVGGSSADRLPAIVLRAAGSGRRFTLEHTDGGNDVAHVADDDEHEFIHDETETKFVGDVDSNE